MKRLIALLCAILLMFASSGMAESSSEIDLKNLTVDELQELIIRSLLEMCSREEFVDSLGTAPSGRMYKSLFGKGISLIFRDTKENYHLLWLDENDVELLFNTRTEKELEGIENLQINPPK